MDQDIMRTAKVTALFQSRGPMKNPILLDLLNYWERLRAGRLAPLRSEIDPRQIENALEHAFILEHVSDGNVRFRLAGLELCDLMGMEVRGMPHTALIDPVDRDDFSATVNGLFARPKIVELNLVSDRPGLPDLQADMLLLPMKSDLGEITRILGCLVAKGPKAVPPHRFRIRSQKVTRIVATESAQTRALLPGFAEPAAEFSPQPVQRAVKIRQPYLRLVNTDKSD